MSRAAVVSRIAHTAADEAPPARAGAPWWRSLERDFYRRPEPFALDLRDRVRVGATAGVDAVIRNAGAVLVTALAVPPGYRPSRLRLAVRTASVYTDFVDRGDRDGFFRAPPDDVPVEARPARRPHFPPEGGRCWDLRFRSPFTPLNPALADEWRRLGRNATAHARYWRHDGPARPTILVIHGFSADPYWLNEWLFELPRFYRMGCDVVLFTLPFHGQRRELWAPFSGHGFFAGGVPRVNEAFAQAIHDARVLLRWLRRDVGAPRVGATGISLGGYTTALLAALDEDLAFAIPNVPVVSLPDLVLEWPPMGWALRGLLRATGLPLEEVRRVMAVHCPLTWSARVPPERLMIIGGVGDRMAPPKHARLLWDHWGRPRLHWFPGSHLLHLDRGEYLEAMRRFFSATGFLDA